MPALPWKELQPIFSTFSVWQNEESLHRFAATDPHHHVVEQLRPRMNSTRFEFFTVHGAELPLGWDQITTRVG